MDYQYFKKLEELRLNHATKHAQANHAYSLETASAKVLYDKALHQSAKTQNTALQNASDEYAAGQIQIGYQYLKDQNLLPKNEIEFVDLVKTTGGLISGDKDEINTLIEDAREKAETAQMQADKEKNRFKWKNSLAFVPYIVVIPVVNYFIKTGDLELDILAKIASGAIGIGVTSILLNKMIKKPSQKQKKLNQVKNETSDHYRDLRNQFNNFDSITDVTKAFAENDFASLKDKKENTRSIYMQNNCHELVEAGLLRILTKPAASQDAVIS